MKRIKEDKGSIGRYVSNTVFYSSAFACNANVCPARACGLSISEKHVKYDKYDVYNLYKNNIDF